MNKKITYVDEIKLARALINRDNRVTKQYFYQQCYPLFKSVYDNYYTDCVNCKEFIDEIYLIVLSPSKSTGKCQMENFKGESTLASWLKSACLFYCYSKFKRKEKLSFKDIRNNNDQKNLSNDRILENSNSYELDMSQINKQDVDKILSLMENERYRNIIRLYFLEGRSNEETADMLNMTMSNFYNKKRLAIKQFKDKLTKEESYE